MRKLESKGGELKGEKESASVPSRTMPEFQFHNIVEHPNPIIPSQNYAKNGLHGFVERQRTNVVCGGIGGIRKSVLPCLEILEIPERDLCEKVLSGTRSPRFGDKAALFEGFLLVVKEVDNAVPEFWWEARVRHRGLGQEGERAIFGRWLSRVTRRTLAPCNLRVTQPNH